MSDDVKVAKTSPVNPKERPYEEAKADPKDIAKAENRPQEDQIKDYHQKHPTLKRTKAEEKAITEKTPEGPAT